MTSLCSEITCTGTKLVLCSLVVRRLPHDRILTYKTIFGLTDTGNQETFSHSPTVIIINSNPIPLVSADLLQLINCHHLHPHAYADDTQIYGFCNPSDTDLLQERIMSVCVDEVSLWMTSNRLLLNPAKTEVLWCYSARRQIQIPVGPVRIVSATRQCFRCLLSGTSGSILTLISL